MNKSYTQFFKLCTNFKSLESNYFHSVCTVYKPRYIVKNCQLSKNVLFPQYSKLIYFHKKSSNFSQFNTNVIDNSLQEESCATKNENNLLQGEKDSDLFDHRPIDYEDIAGGDEESINKLKLLELEVDVLRQDGARVPKRLANEHWKELFSLSTRSQRLRYLAFLWLIEVKKLGDKKKREKRKLVMAEKRAMEEAENEANNHIQYGFQGSTIFVRVYDSTINHFDNSKLVQAMQFGQNLVIDCGYDNCMSHMESKLCAKQLMLLFAENRLDREPFNLQFCNMNRNSVLFQRFRKFVPTLDDPEFPINLSEEHYLDLFPKDKLVYLTPHCRTELTTFNHDDIYIIGALVDRQISEPLSMAKAKSEGIRMAKLPLDRYLDWSIGTKSLTINQVLKILLDIRTTGDWNLALKHVPQRKLRRPEERQRDMSKSFRGTFHMPPPLYDRKNRLNKC